MIAGSRFVSAIPAQNSTQPDLILINGKFVDGRGMVGSRLSIRNGRIVSLSQTPGSSPSGVQTIDLGGRTVIPGLFDAHVHYTRAAMNPGL